MFIRRRRIQVIRDRFKIRWYPRVFARPPCCRIVTKEPWTPTEKSIVNPDDTIPESLNIPLTSLVNLAVEHWRLTVWAAGHPARDAAASRHALRRMEDFLKMCDLEVRTLDGHPFDAGLAARVVDSTDDPQMPGGMIVIAETLSPMVLWRGKVVKAADVATVVGTK